MLYFSLKKTSVRSPLSGNFAKILYRDLQAVPAQELNSGNITSDSYVLFHAILKRCYHVHI